MMMMMMMMAMLLLMMIMMMSDDDDDGSLNSTLTKTAVSVTRACFATGRISSRESVLKVHICAFNAIWFCACKVQIWVLKVGILCAIPLRLLS